MTHEEKYIITRWLYSIGLEPLMDDAEYSALHKYMIFKGSLSDYTTRSWSSDPCPVELLKKYEMDCAILHVELGDKTESIPTIANMYELERHYGSVEAFYLLSFKIDGWNTQATYVDGRRIKWETRGRKAGSDPIDLSRLVGGIPTTIPVRGEVKIVMEACLSTNSFYELRKRFPNKEVRSQRCSVSTAVANEDCWGLLSFIAVDIITKDKEYTAIETFVKLQEWGFQVSKYRIVTHSTKLAKTIEEMGNEKEAYPFITDGLVVRSNVGRDLQAVRVGAWEEKIYYSYITGVKEDHSTVFMGCKVEIRPIMTEHSTQEQVNITNPQRVIENKLEEGSPIAFVLKSGAIADPNLEITSYLQEMWANRYDDYAVQIEIAEELKRQAFYGARQVIEYRAGETC